MDKQTEQGGDGSNSWHGHGVPERVSGRPRNPRSTLRNIDLRNVDLC